MLRRTILALAIGMCLAASGLEAHDDYRILGTVVRVAAPTLEVKQTKDGKTITLTMDSATIVTRDKKKVALSEVRAGQYVVVDARGDSLEDLVVLEVRLVPPPTRK